MQTPDRISDLSQKVELLAPAGKWDVLEAVVAAGADAVYVGPKKLNMRMHRKDFNFSNDQLGRAVELLHEKGRRLYITMNSLLAEHEVEPAAEMMTFLEAIGVDAIIVQDLATLQLARDLNLHTPLHASTMMNVHHAEQARTLKEWNIRRMITSRDIDIHTAREMGRRAEVEIEYFIHGDMCVAQSGQCSMSGLVMGKSANRGECMKPCRWEYELVNQADGEAQTSLTQGHLLGIKDLNMLRHLPFLIQAGICSFKIEGRMRDAQYLGSVVKMYRQAIDTYYDNPPAYALSIDLIEESFRSRLREISTLATLGGLSDRSMFDPTGQRETLFLSNGKNEIALNEDAINERTFTIAEVEVDQREVPTVPIPNLSVTVSDVESASHAIQAGADRIYLAIELSQYHQQAWSLETMKKIAQLARQHEVKIGLKTPRITTSREWTEIRWLLERLPEEGFDYLLAHHLGTISLGRQCWPEATIMADFGLNVLNHKTVEFLQSCGAGEITLSNEASFADLQALVAHSILPLEILAHGPMEGMLLDHCLIALYATSSGRKDVCRGPCKHVRFALKDKTGEVREIVPDQYCRNHLLTAKDLAILPEIDAFVKLGLRSLRIEGQFYEPQWVGVVTGCYRRAIDRHHDGQSNDIDSQKDWIDLLRKSPKPLNYGAYAQCVTRSRSTLEVMREAVS